MVSPDYNDKPEEAHQYDLDGRVIICQYCLKPISATRPPIYNEVNCGCSELGTHAAGINPATQPDTEMLEPDLETTVHGQPAYTYQSSTSGNMFSHAHTSTSREDLLVCETSNDFQDLSIGFSDVHCKNDIGLVRDQPYFIHSYSWPLRAWLKENESSPTISSTPRNSLRTHRSSSVKAWNGSKRGNSSIRSSGSATEPGGKGWGPDPFIATGAWASDNYPEADKHLLTMSAARDSNGN
ncbi:hypothetical protein DSL72_003473 [Monilinia vaccinii-corymbosi]|uniref:Uncharacterized protein n=1 Tax=Monilinia vaccinii-corymbosi TaxID=61207 RepID=A0A8A3P1B5_9HELO|nr:hypothetical protein DSL72_003473 [Monilinia vaccinii-corymbosi]